MRLVKYKDVVLSDHKAGRKESIMTKAEQIKWLQGIECRLYYELDGQHLVDVDKKNKYNRVNALLVKMINKYEN